MWGWGRKPGLVTTTFFSRSIDSTSRTCRSVFGSRRRIGLTTSVIPMLPEITSGSIGWKTK